MPKQLLVRLIALLVLALTPFGASAQAVDDAEKVILVLDASGSMWGQIDGEAKITIARRAINELLDTLPESTQLGLTAYGHREKGSCDDIETLVVPGAQPRSAIRQAIAMISPKGKTPLSKAVQLAAETLKYEENKATVILVSDGIETCHHDPCELGAALEAKGVDFTAHVIGFDVADAAARAQLQCLAENTGGRFLTADTASELVDALQEVSADPPPLQPEAASVDAVFEATDGEGGPVIKSGLVWTLTMPETGVATVDALDIGVLRVPVLPGRYTAMVRRGDGVSAELDVAITADGNNSFVLPLVAELPEASVSVVAAAPQGATIPVTWSGPDERRDYIAVAEIGADGGDYINYSYTEAGNPVQLQLPPIPGDYEIRYILSQGNKILAATPISVTQVDVSVSAVAEAPQGATIPVTWSGPDERRDYIAVAEIGADGGDYINYSYTEAGSPVQLQLPPTPGDYEIRYILNQGNKILAATPISVTQVDVSVSAVAAAPQGATIPVSWVGPDERRDYIAVAEIGADGGDYINYSYTEAGSPVQLQMPPTPGNYEIRYILNQGNKILAAMPISVVPVEASVSAVARAPADSEVIVTWVGPDERRDYIAVAEIGADGGDYINYSYTEAGSPLKLQLPPTPGTYEIRYILSQDNTILATQAIAVE